LPLHHECVRGQQMSFHHSSCCRVPLPSPPLGPVPRARCLLTQPAASPSVLVSSPLRQLTPQPPEPPPPCLSHCWLWQLQLGAHANKPSKAPYLGSLPPLPLPSAVAARHWSFREISVFLIYCKAKGREQKSQRLMIAAALLTFSRAKAGLSVY